MAVTNKDILPIIDLLFEQQYWFYKHQYESFHQFVDDLIYRELKDGIHIFHEDITKDKIYRHKFIFNNISLKPPINDIDDELMLPEDARKKNLTYASKLVVSVQQVLEIVDTTNDTIQIKAVGDEQHEIPIARIPIMVKSKFCTTVIKKDEPNTECRYDPGGYFIVNGSEKVIMSLERICDNKLFVFTKKDPVFKNGIQYLSQVNSKSNDINSNIQMTVVKMRKDNSLIVSMAQLIDIPIFIIFRALGIVTDNDIIKYCVYDMNDIEMVNLLSTSIKYSIFDPTKPVSESNRPIKTQDDAITYLVSKLKQTKKYNETDRDIRNMQRKMHLLKVLRKDFIPHMGDNLIDKACYLGLMVNRVLSAYLGRIEPDDRDSYVNKRVDTPGILLHQLFKQFLKKMMSEISKFFKRKNSDVLNPINVVNQIKPNTIEQGIKAGLLTGSWGSGSSKKGKKGVAQVLQRLTFMQTLSYLRRIATPSVDASTSKVANIRHVHNIQFGFLDPVESPDGHNVGIVKHLSLSAGITLALNSQVHIIKKLLINQLISLQDVSVESFKHLIKVFINGQWIGLTDKPIDIVNLLKNKRMNGIIDKTVSIILDIKMKDIRIYTDGGRLYRPLLRVNSKTNELILTKDIINNVSVYDKTNKNKINSWNQLISKHNDTIDYVDVEETEYLMIAMYTHQLDQERKKLNTPVEPSTNKLNRYDDTVFKRYTHCELHPQMLLGITAAQVPFADHNPSPRNVFNFSQARQAMGIYASNYKHRMDISYILRNPQKPLVTTRAAKWVGVDELPAGENAIVAIACYTGYNQEDSIIANQSSFDRGLYRSISLKKYEEEIKKNQSTSQDDKFIKPDRNEVSGMKDANYDKLNDKGFVPEETEIIDGDIIIGKVSPVQAGTGTKAFKDSSHIYKSNVAGVIDKVYTGIYNQEGYEIYKMRIRSERKPIIGDKFCCYTPDHEVLTTEGWIPIDQLTLNHHVATLNPTTKALEYQKPSQLQDYYIDDKLYSIESNQVSLLVTKNHNMYVAPKGGDNYKLEKAEDILNARRKYKKNCDNYIPPNPMTHFTLPAFGLQPARQLDINAWCVFFGIWIAEGCTLRDWGVSFATHKERVKEALEECCNTLGFKIFKHKDQVYDTERNAWCMNDKQLVAYIKPLSVGAINKSLPDWVWNLNPQQCQLLIHGMVLGDGHNVKGSSTFRYDTSSYQLANDFQRLCLHAGWASNLAIKYKAGHKSHNSVTGKDIVSTVDSYRLSVIKKQVQPLVNKNKNKDKLLDELIDYKGKVFCCTVNNGIIYVRRKGLGVFCGNSRSGQKGTLGITLRRSDMPFTAQGIQPDLIVNPNAIPSRMTIGQLLECVLAKESALNGHFSDATPFDHKDVGEAEDELEKLGFNKMGYETLYCGMTGKKIKAAIFIGPTYYLRLKHLVQDKIHSRAKGPSQKLTRQPPEGRSKDGGLRFGEMERDVAIAHGVATFLKERFVETSDKYSVHVCDTCGLFASKLINKNVYGCWSCKNYTKVSKVVIPYAFKLLIQELQAINILPRIRTKRNMFSH